MSGPVKKVAVLFRYGAGEHVDFLPALPAMLRQLAARGVEVHHFGFRGTRVLPEELRDQMQVHTFGLRVRRESGWDKHLKALIWVAGLPFLGWKLRREKFDAVFVDETLPLSAPFLRWTYPGKLFFTIHDFFTEIYLERHRLLKAPSSLIRRLDLGAWRKLDGIFTRTAAAKRFLVEKGVAADKISAVPDPVDLNLFRPACSPSETERVRNRYGLRKSDLVLVHHGIMHPNKGNIRLVRAVKELLPNLPDLKLLLIGDGPERAELEVAVASLQLEGKVMLTGWLPSLRDISELLQACDIGLVMRKGLPSDHFHVTSTLVHNLACGLPVLAARLDGIQEVMEGRGAGALFGPECGEDFHQQVFRLAADPALRAEMGAQARETAEELFDPEKIATAYVDGILAG